MSDRDECIEAITSALRAQSETLSTASAQRLAETAFDALGVEHVGWEPERGLMRKRSLFFLNVLDPEWRANA